MSRLMKPVLCAALAAAALAVLAAVLLMNRGDAAHGAAYDPAPEASNAVAEIHAQAANAPVAEKITSRFGVFKAAQRPADQLGNRDQGALATHFFADQTHLAAKQDVLSGVGAPTPDDIYVAGGQGDLVCVLYLPRDAEGPGGECVSPEDAAAGRSAFTVEQGRGAEVFGLVPDGVDSVTVTLANGDTVKAPVQDNVYSVLVPTPSAKVTFKGPDGPVVADAPSG